MRGWCGAAVRAFCKTVQQELSEQRNYSMPCSQSIHSTRAGGSCASMRASHAPLLFECRHTFALTPTEVAAASRRRSCCLALLAGALPLTEKVTILRAPIPRSRGTRTM